MSVALWIAQGLLAVAFAFAGLTKLTQPKDKLVGMLAWTEDFSASTIKLIGLAEALGAVGLIVPPLLGLLPWLAPVAALGLAVLMVGAMATHYRRGEPQGIVVNAVLLLLALVVAWGRFGPYAFS